MDKNKNLHKQAGNYYFNLSTKISHKAERKINLNIFRGCKIRLYNVQTMYYLPMTVGSRSTNTARGTCFPVPLSLKKVEKESSCCCVASFSNLPSGWIPCSRQYNSQQLLPICTPACPTWIDRHSLCVEIFNS